GLAAAAVHQQRLAEGRLARMYAANGMRLTEEGDHLGALPWLAEAFALDRGDRSREGMDRIRIATTLRQCPRLLQVWFHDGPAGLRPAVRPAGIRPPAAARRSAPGRLAPRRRPHRHSCHGRTGEGLGRPYRRAGRAAVPARWGDARGLVQSGRRLAGGYLRR